MHPGSSRNMNNVTYSPVHVREGRKAYRPLAPTYTSWGCAFTTALFFIYHFQSVFLCAIPFHPAMEADVLHPRQGHSQLGCLREGPHTQWVRAPLRSTKKGHEQQHSNLRALTISERMQVAKYPKTVVGPFWGHCQFLQCSSCLKWKVKKKNN